MSSLAEHLERQSVLVMESSIPVGMTIDEWRRTRVTRQSRRGPWRVVGSGLRRRARFVLMVPGG
jgi:hypothetical protein